MSKRKLLRIRDSKNTYKELAKALYPYREEETYSIEFIVEGNLTNPIIGIKYPGRKVVKRDVKSNYKWGNLYDFLVIPYLNGVEINQREFTYTKLLKDFYENKKNNYRFWRIIKSIYKNNCYIGFIPKLNGIPSEIFILALKWMWIQEDFNYKFKSNEVDSQEKYVLLNKSGNPTSGGAGRTKFYIALESIRNGHDYYDVKKSVQLS